MIFLSNLGDRNSVAGTDLVYSVFVAGTNLGTLFLLQEQIWGLCFCCRNKFGDSLIWAGIKLGHSIFIAGDEFGESVLVA